MNQPARIGHNSGAVDALPIPEDVRPGPGWTDQMLEMADHIGAYATLCLVEAFGGQSIYVPADPKRGRIRDVIGAVAAEKLSFIYRREYLAVPTARYAISRARRQGLIASARAGDISVSEAARLLRTSRPYASHLVNKTDEGREEGELEPGCRRSIPGQMDLFGDCDDEIAGGDL